MQRNLNRKKTLPVKTIRYNARNWYSAFCIKEKIFIGISYEKVKMKKGRIRVHSDHWQKHNSKWRSKQYEIDMYNKKDGDLILCPKCGGKIDFRIWLSDSKPDFVNVRGI